MEKAGSGILANALRPLREGTIYEHFLLVGAPLNSPIQDIQPKHPAHVEPSVLWQYPPEKPLSTQHVASFCFPQDVIIKALERTKSASGFNEVMFGQLSKLESSDSSFIFMISGGDHLLYGVCVVNTELLFGGNTLLASSNTQAQEVRTRFDYTTPRIYCILTRFPFFRVHFEVLYSIVAKERLRKISMEMGVSEDEMKMKDNEVIDLLHAFYSVQVPKESNSLKFTLPGELRSFVFTCPPGDEDKQIADWGIGSTFKLLNLEAIVNIYQAILLEKHIIFVTPNCGLLSASVLTWLPLLRPYVFQGPVIPIVPFVMQDCLDSPVPYIVGVPHLPQDADFRSRLEKDRIIVNLDNHTVSIPVKVPGLPEAKKLSKSLQPFHKELLEGKKTNPYLTLSEHLKVVPDIVQAFKSYQHWLLEEILAQIPKLEVKEFDATDQKQIEQLVQLMPKAHRDFYGEFFQTQQFSSFAEQLKELAVKKPPMITKHRKTPSASDLFASFKLPFGSPTKNSAAPVLEKEDS